MSAIFLLEKGAAKKIHISCIFKGLLFRNGQPYWYACWCVLRDFCGLSKKCCFATSPEIMSKVGQTSTAIKKQTCWFSVFHLDITCRTLKEHFWIWLVKLGTFVFSEILDHLVSMQHSFNVHNCWHKHNVENCPR